MVKALKHMRQNIQQLLFMNPILARRIFKTVLLNQVVGPVSERELRTRYARSLVTEGIQHSSRDRSKMLPNKSRQLAALLRVSTAVTVSDMILEERIWYQQQSAMFQAYLVAPADVQSRMRLMPTEDGGFSWDAAPLVELLTASDLKQLLKDPGAVRAWLRRQHRLPEPARPAGAPADPRSPRDLCDLLLNIPLLTRALLETSGSLDTMEEDDHTVTTGLPQFEEMQIALLCRLPLLYREVNSHFFHEDWMHRTQYVRR